MTAPPSDAIGIIPARLESTRFPNKIFEKLDGIPILQRVILNVLQSGVVEYLVVATDSKEVVNFCQDLGVETIYNTDPVLCGSQRTRHVYVAYPDYRWYVTFPADEALILPQTIKDMWTQHENTIPTVDEYIRTCYSPFYSKERMLSHKSCKIIDHDGYATYFSRSPIPYTKNGLAPLEEYKKHVGIFIFENDLFRHYDAKIWQPGRLGRLEGLEQQAFLDNNLKVRLLKINHKYYGVDTPEDIRELERIMK